VYQLRTTWKALCGAACLALLGLLTLHGCLEDPLAPVSGPFDREGETLAIEIGPLSYPGARDVCYTFAVVNAAGEVVVARGSEATLTDAVRNPAVSDWTNAGALAETALVCSSQYGSGPSGGWSFVAPCDASDGGGTHAVTLWLERIDVDGDAEPLAAGVDYHDPCPTGCRRPAACEPNADTAVRFDITVMRAATQGFFDLAIAFDDLFCSAKVDCVNDALEPLNLLHHPHTGTRGQTAVVGLACTTGASQGATVLLRDPVVVACDGATLTLDPGAGHGNILGPVLPAASPGEPVWQYAVYRDSQAVACGSETCTTTYWNVAIGFDPTASECTLTTAATAGSASALPGFVTPAAATWPVVEYDVPLTWPGGGLRCTRHPINGAPAGVSTTYTDVASPRSFAHRFGDGESSSPLTCGPGLVAFDHTGAEQSFVVPPGCSEVTVKVWGAGGGSGGQPGADRVEENADGGAGGYVRATLAVTPGEALTIAVGGGGSRGIHASPSPGGWPGGGSGNGSGNWAGGGGGGGFSGVFRGAVAPENALVVAGAGGGGISANGRDGAGGAGGGLVGNPGGRRWPGQEGGGGSQVSGGAAGADGGGAGAQLQGGPGHGSHIAGGGGAGWFGGGGGGWLARRGGGGGGGSSYTAPAGVTAVAHERGVWRIAPRSADHDYVEGVAHGGDGLHKQDGGPGRVVVLLGDVAPEPEGCTPGSLAFHVTGQETLWVAPAGCENLTATLWGGGGGGGGQVSCCTNSVGGAGGFAAGTLALTPGEELLVVVGSAGDRGYEGAPAYGSIFGGGHTQGSSTWAGGGAGGGFSGLFSGTVSQEGARLMAGGGGGGISANGENGQGGAGGGTIGQDGAERAANQRGRGGGPAAGGAGGADGGHPGGPMQGGAGHDSWIAGGGGGGFWGGGGGGWTSSHGGGGGGGAGFLGAAVIGGAQVTGDRQSPPQTDHPDYQPGIAEGGPRRYRGEHGMVVLHWY